MRSERPAKLDKIRQEALERIAKTEQLQIRLEPELWDALYKLAGKRRVHISSMVRDWIKDRLAVEAKRPSTHLSQLDAIEQKIDKLLSKQTRAESA